jgi:hypothetical protein
VTPEARSVPDVDDPWLLDRVLAGQAGDSWASVTALLTAAAEPAEPAELEGEPEAVASFLAARQTSGAVHAPGRAAARGAGRVAVMSTLLAGRFAAVTVASVVTLGAGGMAAAAYTGLLPAPLQGVAHRTIGAPLPDHSELHSPTAPPSATHTPAPSTSTTSPRSRHTTPGQSSSTSTTQQPMTAVADLCAAWRQQLLPTSAPGFVQLTQAAGSNSIDAFCNGTPTTSPTQTPTSTGTASDSPSPTDTPSSTPPATASDEPTPPPMTASDQPAPPTTEEPVDQPTGT